MFGRGGQLSSPRYEELLGLLLNQKIHILARISKYIPQKKLRSTLKALVTIYILFTSLGNSWHTNKS